MERRRLVRNDGLLGTKNTLICIVKLRRKCILAGLTMPMPYYILCVDYQIRHQKQKTKIHTLYALELDKGNDNICDKTIGKKCA